MDLRYSMKQVMIWFWLPMMMPTFWSQKLSLSQPGMPGWSLSMGSDTE